MDVHEYDLTVTPDKGRKAKMQMLENLCQGQEWGAYASDGQRLWIAKNEDKEAFVLSVQDQQVEIALKSTRSFKLRSSEAKQLHNVIARQAMHDCEMTMGPSHRVYEAQKQTVTLPQWGVSITEGFKTSVAPMTDGNLMINVDFYPKIRQTASLLDVLRQSGNRKKFENLIIGKVVEASYAERFFVVTDVRWDKSPRSTFLWRGKDISFDQYVKERYQLKTVIDPDQPMVEVRNKYVWRNRPPQPQQGGEVSSSTMQSENPDIPIFLIPQLCSLTGLPDNVRTNLNARKEIDQYTKLNGQQRAGKVQHFIDQLSSAPIFRMWNILLDKEMETVPATIGADNHLLMGDGDIKVSKDKTNFGAAIRDHPVYRAAELSNWLVVHPSSCKAGDIDNLIQHMIKEGNRLKIKVQQPKRYNIGNVDTRNRGYGRVYADAMKTCPAINDQNLQIALVVIPGGSKNETEYGKLKEFFEGLRRLKCQFIQDKYLDQMNSKRMKEVFHGVLTQMNWKLGGVTWAVKLPNEVNDTCFVGIDVSHRPGQTGASILAIAIGIDPKASRFHAEFFPQSPGQERMDNVERSIERGLLEYMRTTRVPPKRILVFRDGVGDGQFKDVERNEVPQYRNAFAKVFGADTPYEFYMVVCSKDTSARIFDLAQQNGNAPAGTMVKDVIIPEGRKEFFVIPHTAQEGGALPTRFSILQSHGTLTIPQLAQTARALCVGYNNFPGAIRLPVPVQLAHVMSKHMAVSYNPSGTITDQELERLLENYAQLSLNGSAWYV